MPHRPDVGSAGGGKGGVDLSTEVQFVDTTLRDGYQCLWAQRMPASRMLAIAEQMDRTGYLAMDVIATADFKICVRDLKEDPFERLDLMARKLRHTTMASMCGPQPPTTFGFSPQSIIRLYFERLAAHGIRRMHMMEASNDIARVEPTFRLAKAAGLEVMIALTYSWTPKHTDEYYRQRAQQAVRMGADRIYLKDPGGLITPEQVRTLLPVILDAAGDVPVEFHTHCTTSLAGIAYLEAIRLGVRVVHTAIPPLANGTSQPSLFNMLQNLETMDVTTSIDVGMAREASRRLQRLARIYGLPEGAPLEYDHTQYVHQIPGGVMSTLRHQLTQMGAESRMAEVVEESVRVRKDLGYPIMVTPFSQFVVSQATLNVLMSARYSEVVDEVINYTLGLYGAEAASGVDPAIRMRILDRPRAQELEGYNPPEPSLSEVRAKFGGPDLSDDDLLLRYIMNGDREVRLMREHGPIVEHPSSSSGLLELVHGLARQTRFRHIVIQKGDFRLELGAAAPDDDRGAPGRSGTVADTALRGAGASGVPVMSPAVGIFRLVPDQGTGLSGQVGDRVARDATIGVIDVLGETTPVKAKAAGVLASICVPDGQLVEYGQTLCYVQPTYCKR